MSKTIIIVGFGSGISSAVAELFGSQGYTVALVARRADKLTEGVAALEAKGVKAKAFPADVSKPEEARALIGKVREALGPIDAIHWNAYGGAAGDLTTATSEELRAVFDIPVVSLIASVQAALPDLKARKGALLVTNGGLGFFDPAVDAMAVSWGAMGLAIANSAKHKTVGLLAAKLKDEGVYVATVIVTGAVKGTAWDQGNATIEPKAVAQKFWELLAARKDLSATV